MDRPYDDIPREGGTHRGAPVEEEPTTSVRAQDAPYPPEEEPKPPAPAFRLFYNAEDDVYRVHSWHTEPIDVTDAGFEEVDPSGPTDAEVLMGHLPDRPRVLVLENPETGEVLVERDRTITNWTADGKYTQVTIFADEEKAVAYADRQRRRGGRDGA